MGDIADYMMEQEMDRMFGGQSGPWDEGEQFDEAVKIAADHGMKLRRCSDSHYQLRGPGHRPFIQNIYPGNRRLCWDRNHPKPPYIQTHDWSLVAIVKEHARLTKGGAS